MQSVLSLKDDWPSKRDLQLPAVQSGLKANKTLMLRTLPETCPAAAVAAHTYTQVPVALNRTVGAVHGQPGLSALQITLVPHRSFMRVQAAGLDTAA